MKVCSFSVRWGMADIAVPLLKATMPANAHGRLLGGFTVGGLVGWNNLSERLSNHKKPVHLKAMLFVKTNTMNTSSS